MSGAMRRHHLDDDWWNGIEGEAAVTVPDLSCPTCGTNLAGDDAFRSHRVCGTCRRHFPLRARERLALIVDADSFRETSAAVIATEPATSRERGLAPRFGEAEHHRVRDVVRDAVVTGTARITGQEIAVAVLDDQLVGAAMGAVVAEKIILAFELALARSIPVVVICAGGAARTRPGPLSSAQGARLAATASRLHLAGVPIIAVLTHPAVGDTYSGLASQSDILVAEPGTHVGAELVAWSGSASGGDGPVAVERLLPRGVVDDIIDRAKLRGYLATLVAHLSRRGTLRSTERISRRPATTLTAWEAVAAVRHIERPGAESYLPALLDDFVELHGDRVGADDAALIGGIGRLGGLTVAVIAQRREGPATVAAARKAVRMARLAGHLELSLILLVDGPAGTGEGSAVTPELSQAVAQLLGLLVMLPVPLVAVAIGEVHGPLSNALMVADRMLIQDHALFVTGDANGSVGVSSGLVGQGLDTARSSVLTARECLRLGLVDGIVPEPAPAAHADPEWAAATLRDELSVALGDLVGVSPRRLLDARQRRLRTLGQSTPEALAAAQTELRDLQEWQRSLRRSLDGLRERWEHRTFARPHVTLQRPELSDLAHRLAVLRTETGRLRQPREPSRLLGRREVEDDKSIKDV